MTIELNRTTFKRLVWFYLFLLGAGVVALVIELFVWSEFSKFNDAFDKLAIDHFGQQSEFQLGAGAVLAFAHIVALIGLLRFKRWARSLFWISLLLMIVPSVVPGFLIYWAGPLTSWIGFFDTAALGAILLLAYAREYGAIWFARPPGEYE